MTEPLKKIYENSTCAVLCFDGDEKLLWQNAAATRLIGEQTVKELAQVLLPEAQKLVEKPTDPTSLCRLSGNPDLGIASVLLQKADESEGGWLAVLFPFSEDSAYPLSEQVVSSVLAQYRDPIFTIYNMLSPLKKKMEELEDYDACQQIDRIGLMCYRTVRVTNNLSDFFKYHSHSYKPHFSRVNLNCYLEELCYATRRFVSHASIGFRFEDAADTIVSEVSPDMLSTALYHLIANACLYTRPGNEIVVRLEATEQEYCIMVSDRGLGIPLEMQPYVFTPFFSYDPNGSPASGVGLGLSIVKQVVQRHHGSCIITSAPNEGTTVAMRFPIINTTNQPILESPNEVDIGRFSPLCIHLTDICEVGTVDTL